MSLRYFHDQSLQLRMTVVRPLSPMRPRKMATASPTFQVLLLVLLRTLTVALPPPPKEDSWEEASSGWDAILDVQCQNDTNCAPYPGGFQMSATPFCAADGKCSKWKAGHPLGPDGYQIYLGGEDHTRIKRNVFPPNSGFPASFVFRVPLGTDEQTQVTLTTTDDGRKAVKMPLYSPLYGSYSKKASAVGSEESGTFSIQWNDNPYSVLSNTTKMGAAVKLHTLQNHGKPWCTRSLERVRDQISKMTPLQKAAQRKVSQKELDYQDGKVVSAATGLFLGARLTEGCIDPDHLGEVQRYAESEDFKAGITDRLESEDLSLLSSRAQQVRDDAAPVPASLKSENQCLHFEDSPGFKISDDKSYFVFPLNQNMVMFSGLAPFAPMRLFGLFIGTALFRVHEGALELYFTASQHTQVQMDMYIKGDDISPTGMYVGAPDGKSMKVSEVDGRADSYMSHDPKPTGQEKLWAALVTPRADFPNYARLWNESHCNMAEKADLKRTMGQMARAAMPVMMKKTPEEQAVGTFYNTLYKRVSGVGPETRKKILVAAAKLGGASLPTDLDPWSTSSLLLNLFASIANSVDCNANYLRGDVKYTHGFDILEFLVHGHMVAECPAGKVYDMTVESNFWNDGVVLENVPNPFKKSWAELFDPLGLGR